MPNANGTGQGQDPQGDGNEQVAGHSDNEEFFTINKVCQCAAEESECE